jgi:DNA primase
VFLVEGLFDAVRLHSLGKPALAVLSNNPTKDFANQLFVLGRKYVALCDGDSSGLKLAKFAHEFVQCPEGHDVASVDERWLNDVLKNWR